MTARTPLTRRMLLKDMGKAGLAMMILGTSACSAEPDSDDTTTSPEPATTTPPGTSTVASSDTTVPATTEGHSWQRVDLGFVSAYILYRAGEASVVDTGVDGSALSIESGLEEVGLGWSDVNALILTHKHPDHQGSAQGVMANVPAGTPWYAGAGDIDQITAAGDGIPVDDGHVVSGLEIIATPGHTPGHISVLDPLSGILVTGDALNGENGGVAGANPGFSEDMGLADASVAKLASYDYEIALFGHGEPILTGASAAVAELAASLG